jgi:tRNA1(Val) A37 N6-methylase TrmN6
MEGELDLEAWLKACLKRLRPRGRLVVVHRADRLDALLAALHGRVGDIELLPLRPKVGSGANRVLLRGRHRARGPLTLWPALVLHEADGAYSGAAQAVLRRGEGVGG